MINLIKNVYFCKNSSFSLYFGANNLWSYFSWKISVTNIQIFLFLFKITLFLQQKQNSHNKQRSRLFNNCNDRTFNEFFPIYLLVEAAARSSSAKMVFSKFCKIYKCAGNSLLVKLQGGRLQLYCKRLLTTASVNGYEHRKLKIPLTDKRTHSLWNSDYVL